MILEDLFEMGGGYVLEFSNNSFQRFVKDSIDIDIYNSTGYEEYCSKAYKMRQIWDSEPDAIVGKLLEDLLLLYRARELKKKGNATENLKETIQEMLVVAKKMQENNKEIGLPDKDDETLQTLLDDINSALTRDKPALVLDRLHTFATKFIRQICIDNNIAVTDQKKNYYPLHSLAGMLRKHYETSKAFKSEFSLIAIKNCISLFEAYNSIRNNQSYAHDNEVLDKIEAEFAVNLMVSIIKLFDKYEALIKEGKE